MPNTHIPKSTADKGKAIAHELKHTFGTGTGASFADNRPEALALGSQIQLMRDSAQAQQLGAVQRMTNNSAAPVQLATKRDASAHLAKENLALVSYAMFNIKPWLTGAQAEGPLAAVATQCLTLLNAVLAPKADKTGLQALITQVVNTLNMEIDRVATATTPSTPSGASTSNVPSSTPTPSSTPILAPGNPTGEAMASTGHKLGGPTMAPPSFMAPPVNRTGEAMASGAGGSGSVPVHEAPKSESAPKPPSTATKIGATVTKEMVIMALQEEVETFIKKDSPYYNTGYNGPREPNEVISWADLQAVVAYWNSGTIKLPPGMTQHQAKSSNPGKMAPDMHDFLLYRKGNSSAAFNFHIEYLVP